MPNVTSNVTTSRILGELRNSFDCLMQLQMFRGCSASYEPRVIDDGNVVAVTMRFIAPADLVDDEEVEGRFECDHQPFPICVSKADLALAEYLVEDYQAQWRSGGPGCPLPPVSLEATDDGLTLTADYGGAHGKVSVSYLTPAELHAALVEVRADAYKAA